MSCPILAGMGVGAGESKPSYMPPSSRGLEFRPRIIVRDIPSSVSYPVGLTIGEPVRIEVIMLTSSLLSPTDRSAAETIIWPRYQSRTLTAAMMLTASISVKTYR